MNENYLDNLERKKSARGIEGNSKKSSGKSLGKNGQVYQNDLLMTDYTSGMRINKKPGEKRMK